MNLSEYLLHGTVLYDSNKCMIQVGTVRVQSVRPHNVINNTLSYSFSSVPSLIKLNVHFPIYKRTLVPIVKLLAI